MSPILEGWEITCKTLGFYVGELTNKGEQGDIDKTSHSTRKERRERKAIFEHLQVGRRLDRRRRP